MDDQRNISQAAAAVLGAYLPYIWHDNPPATGSRERWQAFTRFWLEISPAVQAVPGGSEAVSASMDTPTEENLQQLASILEDLLDDKRGLYEAFAAALIDGPFADVAAQMAAEEPFAGLEEWSARVRRGIATPEQQTDAPAAEATFYKGVPSCDICGRQDATLRFVSYPYTMSFLLVTLRRSFIGLWCGRHARIKHALASLITATIGWLGVPFGLLFTPIALGQLAGGGIQPAEANQQLLRDLARHKNKEGDRAEAIRCLEAALEFGDDDAIRAELLTLYRNAPQKQTEASALTHIALFAALLIGAMLLGMVIGFADLGISSLMGSILGGSGTIIETILSWIPTVAMLFLGALIHAGAVKAAIRRTQLSRPLLGRLIALTSSVIAIYSVPSGTVLASLLFSSAISFSYLPGAFHDVSWALTQGGANLLLQYLLSGEVWQMLYILIVMGAALLFVWSALMQANRALKTARIVREVWRESSGVEQPASAAGWLSLFGAGGLFVVMLMASILLTPSSYGDPQLLGLFSKGMSALNSGDMDGARAAFDQANAIDPDSFITQMGYGVLNISSGDCLKALDHFEAARAAAPTESQSGLAGMSGLASLCMDHVDEAIVSLEESIVLDPTLVLAHFALGRAYADTGNFSLGREQLEIAAELDEEWASPVISLAILDYWEGDQQMEEQHYTQALTRTLDEVDEYFAISGYYYQKNDFAQARTYVDQGLDLEPYNINALFTLVSVNIALGDLAEAEEALNWLEAITPSSPEVFSLRSSLYLEQAQPEQALQVLQDGLAAHPESATLHATQAVTYVFIEEYDLGVREAQAVLEINPYSTSANIALALAYQAQGRLNPAYTAAMRALELYPKSDLAYYVLGNYYMAQGDLEKAQASYESFLALTWDRAYVRDYADHAREALAQIQVAP